MPTYLLKATQDTEDSADDFYVGWSTVVDAPVSWGTYQEYLNENPENAERLERARRTGTSAYSKQNTGAFGDPLLVMNPEPGILQRADLKAYCLASSEEEAQKFLTPLKYEDEN